MWLTSHVHKIAMNLLKRSLVDVVEPNTGVVFTVVHRNIPYKTKYVPNYFSPGYNYNYINSWREKYCFACANVSHGRNASITIT